MNCRPKTSHIETRESLKLPNTRTLIDYLKYLNSKCIRSHGVRISSSTSYLERSVFEFLSTDQLNKLRIFLVSLCHLRQILKKRLT
jgi:hypothetical protein